MVRMKKSSSRAASPLAQAEERISNLKKPIDMCYKAQRRARASPLAQAEERKIP